MVEMVLAFCNESETTCRFVIYHLVYCVNSTWTMILLAAIGFDTLSPWPLYVFVRMLRKPNSGTKNVEMIFRVDDISPLQVCL